MRSRRHLAGLWVWGILFGVLSISGCGGAGKTSYTPDGMAKGSVSGKVLLGDKPLTGGTVIFTHANAKVAVPATSAIAADGSYSLEMIDTLQIPVGLYKITVQAAGQAAMSEAEYEAFMAKGMDGSVKEAGASAIPAQYQRPETTTLKYEVKEGENKNDVKLTK